MRHQGSRQRLEQTVPWMHHGCTCQRCRTQHLLAMKQTDRASFTEIWPDGSSSKGSGNTRPEGARGFTWRPMWRRRPPR